MSARPQDIAGHPGAMPRMAIGAQTQNAMRVDISGWQVRLNDADIERYTRAGLWRNETLAQCAARLAHSAPQRVAVVEGDRQLTYAQVFSQAQQLARAFGKLGLQAGDVVSCQLPNWVETMVINLAACLCGIVVNPIVPIYRDAEVRYILRDARAKVFFVPQHFRGFEHAAMAARLRLELPALRHVVVVRGQSEDCMEWDTLMATGREGLAPQPVVDPNAVKLVLYTSGTTGNPKGVLHSHNTLMAEMCAVIDFWGIDARDVSLMPSPVTHITGYLYALEMCFVGGVKVVFMERWDAETALALIDAHGATFSVGATPFLRELTEAARQRGRPPSSLRMFISGGAPVPPEAIHEGNRVLRCRCFRVYGSSEAPTVTLGIQDDAPAGLGATTDGHIVNHEVRLCDAHTGQPLHDGEGEICTRGPEMMLGYTDPAQTAEAFDADGFFHTGDLGYVVERNYLCVSGRKKDLIIRGGENISPKEIEDHLHAHPDIQEAAVVAMPHARLGEGVCAFVIPQQGAHVDVATLAAFLERVGLARQKFPERVELVDMLPRTAAGKVQKNLLRQRIARQMSNETKGTP